MEEDTQQGLLSDASESNISTGNSDQDKENETEDEKIDTEEKNSESEEEEILETHLGTGIELENSSHFKKWHIQTPSYNLRSLSATNTPSRNFQKKNE